MAFKIVVCAKQVPDTNEIKINPETGSLIRDGVPSILNPDDANALEEALRIKDTDPENIKVTVVSMGPPQAQEMLFECIAMGADDAVLLSDRAVGGSDTWATSNAITAAIEKIGEFDMIIGGRQAIDGDTAQVGPQIAENLGIPQVSYAEEIDVNGDVVTVRRQYEDRHHMIDVKTPCLITALQELAEPRYMHAGGVIDAYAKDITVWGFDDLKDGLNPDFIGLNGSPTKVVTSFGKMAKGAGTKLDVSPDEAVAAIIAKMEEKHII